jgi:hypothetical protein
MSYNPDAIQKGLRQANDEIIAMKKTLIQERDDKKDKLINMLQIKAEKLAEKAENTHFKSLSHYDNLTKTAKIAQAQSVIMDNVIQYLATLI